MKKQNNIPAYFKFSEMSPEQAIHRAIAEIASFKGKDLLEILEYSDKTCWEFKLLMEDCCEITIARFNSQKGMSLKDLIYERLNASISVFSDFIFGSDSKRKDYFFYAINKCVEDFVDEKKEI